MPGNRPAAEVRIDVPLVRRLVASQFPQWANLAVEPVESAGWDNAIFRLGPDLAVRLPRRLIGAEQVEKEHRWIPVLAPHLPLPVPIPVGHGVPGEGYPWHWTVCPWLNGELAAVTKVADPGRAARSLARFISAMQAVDSAGGPVHEFRGVSLAAHDHNTRTAAAILRDRLDVDSALAVWDAALAVPAWAGRPAWIHGDLHPANLLVEGHELSAVTDFGLLGVGDPACDLMVAWTYLSADSRAVFRAALAVDDQAWSRGRGWATHFALRAAAYSEDNPLIGDIGRYTISEILADSALDSG
ncbi:MAG TPA: aminoglycoside phosphotransferase family protein [Streptosporangiaceae bacterium]|nr:aminoglycoside phosphotransferase family protein [Streptosporangiaceae bacterium]